MQGADVSPAPFLRPVGQEVKTPPFHGGNMGSSPVRVTKEKAPPQAEFFLCPYGTRIMSESPGGAFISQFKNWLIP